MVHSRMESSDLDRSFDADLINQPFWLSLSEKPHSTLLPTSSIQLMLISTHTPVYPHDANVMMQQDMIQSFQGQFYPNSYRYRDPSNDSLNQWHRIIN